jgi:hypothetical protein
MYLIVVILIIVYVYKYINFDKSEYSSRSGNRFLETMKNKGKKGEYLIFKRLEEIKGDNIIMTGLYLPKRDGTTTEVDIVMISQKGIYVIESKNFSGWIYGNEKDKDWIQAFKNGNKNKFFNPVWQNKGHITGLKNVLDFEHKHYKSYIVFGENCELKDITTISNVEVLKINDFMNKIILDMKKSEDILSIREVLWTYEKLKKYELVDETIKREHIRNIRKKIRKKS